MSTARITFCLGFTWGWYQAFHSSKMMVPKAKTIEQSLSPSETAVQLFMACLLPAVCSLSFDFSAFATTSCAAPPRCDCL